MASHEGMRGAARRPGGGTASTVLAVVFSAAVAAAAPPTLEVDIADLDPSEPVARRVFGSVGNGSLGVPVAGGFDVDGDRAPDTAFSAMRAGAFGRAGAGQVFLVLGDGRLLGSIDTAVPSPEVLRLGGGGPSEAAGSELWMDDVTGDGLGDLLIARQNFSPTVERRGAGALTILVGGPGVRDAADAGAMIDLRSRPDSVTLTTFVGAEPFDRLGIWMRTGDVTGDGIADVVVGADQASQPGQLHRGAVYVIRGGPHLGTGLVVDLADFGATPLDGHVARIDPPPSAREFHFGATCQIADLDDNGRAEVLAAATLNRAGASIRAAGAPAGSAHASGGSPRGTLYIAWDDNFPDDLWPAGYRFSMAGSPGSRTVVRGASDNVSFGEEILGGLDYDGDGLADLFVGDIVGDGTGSRPQSGLGHVLYGAERLKGLQFRLDDPPIALDVTTVLGGAAGDIAADTAAHGDFDGDGLADLALGSPHGSPRGRDDAGELHVFHGQPGGWPAEVDLAPGALPRPEDMRVTRILGANGRVGADRGDTLMYSAAAGDLDGDGRDDLIINEMVGNGVAPTARDVGNLLLLSGRLLFRRDVALDVKPASRRNVVRLDEPAPLRVALLGDENFDVRDVDPRSLSLGPDRAAPNHDLSRRLVRFLHRRDVDDDGNRDLVMHFGAAETGLRRGDDEACVEGAVGTELFLACDDVVVRGEVDDGTSIFIRCGNGFVSAFAVPPLLWLRRRLRS